MPGIVGHFYFVVIGHDADVLSTCRQAGPLGQWISTSLDSSMHTVYVIQSEEGYRYIGYTIDMEKRHLEHNQHSRSFWTKRGTNWKLIYIEKFEIKSEALKREKWLKSGIGRKFIHDHLKQS